MAHIVEPGDSIKICLKLSSSSWRQSQVSGGLMPIDMVCMTEFQFQQIKGTVNKLKGWLDYSKNIVDCLQSDNLKLVRKVEQLEKQIKADQYGQIFRINQEHKLLTL